MIYVDDLRLRENHRVGQELVVAGHVVVQDVLDGPAQVDPGPGAGEDMSRKASCRPRHGGLACHALQGVNHVAGRDKAGVRCLGLD